MSYEKVELSQFMVHKRKSINPEKFPEETFQLYSIPAYDRGIPDIEIATKIGSSKKIIKDNDVLLSRIVPHIRRCWLIKDKADYRRIGSGEWIVFNSPDIYSDYLRFYFYSNYFNAHFLRNLRGVGGSLMRANPKLTGEIKIPLPSLETQKRIARILDQADGLRRKNAELLDYYDKLVQSVFLEMFGVENTDFPNVKMGELVTFIGGGTPKRAIPEYFTGDICWATSKDIKNDFQTDTQEHITEEAILNSSTKLVEDKAILMVVKSKILARTLPIAISLVPICFGQDLKALIPNDSLNINFLFYHIKINEKKILQKARGANTEGLTLEHLRNFEIFLPEIELQNEFAKIVNNINAQKAKLRISIQESENLFQCLLQKAFKGEL